MPRKKKQTEVTTEGKMTDKDTAETLEVQAEVQTAPEEASSEEEAAKPAAKRTKKAGAKKAEKAGKDAKAAKEPKTTTTAVHVQYNGRTINPEEVLESAKAAWVAKGHRVSSIKNLELYINVTESKAYPVINGEPQDGLDC